VAAGRWTARARCRRWIEGAGAAAWAVARLLTGLPRWLPGIAGALAFTALFAIASWALGARELGEIAAPLKRRLLRRRA
jgi:hypothetical protein